jgi:membrane protease YdiL (CAAX protease family)
VEELLFRGYAQARLVAIGQRPWLGILLPAIGFGLQHLAFAPSVTGAIAYVAGFTLWGLGAGLIYHRQRRLGPLIVAHFLSNLIPSLSGLLVALQYQ